MRFMVHPDTPFTTSTESTYKSGFVVQTTGATSHFTQRALHTPEITPDKEAASVKAIEEDIKFGRLPPGMRLVEDPLMSRFAVTPHVIRRALAKLERTGIIVREKTKVPPCDR